MLFRSAEANGVGVNTNGPNANGVNGHGPPPNQTTTSTQPTSSLKDQQKLSLRDNLELFTSSVNRLATRLQAGEDTIAFDKDDDDTLDFVTASANLRSVAYGIDGKTRWEVKEMAGNIIPAIATTNAIIAGLIVLQALHILKSDFQKLRNVHIQIKPAVPLSAITLSRPNNNCGVCRDTYVSVQCDPARTRLGELVQAVLESQGEDLEEVSVYEDKRILSDPDFDDNVERTLESLNVGRGKFLTIVDEDGVRNTIVLALGVLPENHPDDAPPFILPSPMPIAPKSTKTPLLPVPAPSTPPRTSLKRTFDEVELDSSEQEPSAKRAKVPESPSKRKTLDEDGVVVMDGKDDSLDDEG